MGRSKQTPEEKAAVNVAANRAWRKNHPGRDAANKRKRRETLASRPRPDACEICGRPPGRVALHFDHDKNHCKDGCAECFRGWLCHYCNIALGNCLDSTVILSGLI